MYGKRDNFSQPSNAHDEKHFDYGGHTLLILISHRLLIKTISKYTKTHIIEEQNEKDQVSHLENINIYIIVDQIQFDD